MPNRSKGQISLESAGAVGSIARGTRAGAAKDQQEAGSRKRHQPFRIVHQDIQILVADKDPGILAVPIPGKRSENLKELLDEYLSSQKREALTVHRIDRYTSGLVVFAKNRKAWEKLVAQFRARSPERVYLALVRGEVSEPEGTLRHQLELTTDGFRQRVVRSGGTEAVTHFRVLERYPGATLLEVRLESGLKNQIRVQFRAYGHPLVGDRHYAAEEAQEVFLKRQALHAWRLGFLHPGTGRPVSYEAPLAADMGRLIEKLRKRPPPPAAGTLEPDKDPSTGPISKARRPRPGLQKPPGERQRAKPPLGKTAPKPLPRGAKAGRRAKQPASRPADPVKQASRSRTKRPAHQAPPTRARHQAEGKRKPAARKQNGAKRRRPGS